MGWFLPFSLPGSASRSESSGRRQAKSKGKSKRKTNEGRTPWDPTRTLLGLKIVSVAAAVVGLGLAWQTGQAALLTYASQHRATPITPDRVVLLDAPNWITQTRLQARLQTAAAERIQPNPFDGRGLTDAAAALTLDPYIQQVHQIRRTPQGITVEADYREPLAMVKARDGFHLVDTQGVHLAGPASSWQSLEPTGLPLITHVAAAAPRELGRPWPGEEIQAGVELVKLLRDQPYADQITAYDVGQRDPRTGRLFLVLHTDAGAVFWGRPPSDAWSVAEVSTQEKLDRLARNAQRSPGRIDLGGQLVYIHTQQVQTEQRPTALGYPRIEPVPAQHAAQR